MPKDALGHGSNSRGGYQNIDMNLKGPGKHVGYANGPWQIGKLGAGYLATHSQTGESFRGDSLRHVSDQLAQRALSSGTSKSDAAPIHDAFASAAQHRDPDRLAKDLEDSYRAQHGWSGDVGKHNGG